jgi:hypothetical protein
MSRKLPFCTCGKKLSRKDAVTCINCRDYAGKNNPMFGRKRDDMKIVNKRIRDKGLLKGENNPMYGRKRVHSDETKRKISLALSGSNNPMYKVRLKGEQCGSYKDGRTSLSRMIREIREYKIWRNEVFERDNYTCQECFKRGGDLEAHHIKSFKDILQEFLNFYSQFSPIEDKYTLVRLSLSWKNFWDTDNGIVLCRNCHELTFT